MLNLFGDKSRARLAAANAGVPIINGTDKATSLEEAESWLDCS